MIPPRGNRTDERGVGHRVVKVACASAMASFAGMKLPIMGLMLCFFIMAAFSDVISASSIPPASPQAPASRRTPHAVAVEASRSRRLPLTKSVTMQMWWPTAVVTDTVVREAQVNRSTSRQPGKAHTSKKRVTCSNGGAHTCRHSLTMTMAWPKKQLCTATSEVGSHQFHGCTQKGMRNYTSCPIALASLPLKTKQVKNLEASLPWSL